MGVVLPVTPMVHRASGILKVSKNSHIRCHKGVINMVAIHQAVNVGYLLAAMEQLDLGPGVWPSNRSLG